MPASFDGDNLLITLPAATAEIDAKVDLYSDWKEWFKTPGNAKFSLAFDTTGGDPTTATGAVSAFFFLRNDNGWRIKPAEEDAEVVIVGNLYPRDVTLPVFTQTTGAFTVLLTIERDASSVVETVTSGSGLDAGQDTKLTEIHGELRAIEGGEHHSWFMRVFLAALGNKLAGAATTTVTARDKADTKDRITATVDADGNRSAVTLDGD